MNTKTRNVLFIVAAALLLAGAAFGIIYDSTKDDPEVPEIEQVDTVEVAPVDTVAVDTVVVE